VPVPAFNTQGLLPPVVGDDAANSNRSPYYISMVECAQHFGTTDHRRNLLRHLIAYRTLIAADGYVSGIQFLDGSFVENVEQHSNRPPNDIDVFSLLHVPQKYHGNEQHWVDVGGPYWAQEIANQELNKQRFSLDTYALLVEELPLGGLLQNVMYWQSLFSHQRDTFAWKGFVAILLDPNQDAEALGLLGGA
jgi:hypothetical protein